MDSQMILKPNSNPDFTQTREACKGLIEELETSQFYEVDLDDHVESIYQKAMEAVFGHRVWAFLNAKRGKRP